MYYFTLASLFFLSFVGRISPTPLYVFYPVTETFFFSNSQSFCAVLLCGALPLGGFSGGLIIRFHGGGNCFSLFILFLY